MILCHYYVLTLQVGTILDVFSLFSTKINGIVLVPLLITMGYFGAPLSNIIIEVTNCYAMVSIFILKLYTE